MNYSVVSEIFPGCLYWIWTSKEDAKNCQNTHLLCQLCLCHKCPLHFSCQKNFSIFLFEFTRFFIQLWLFFWKDLTELNHQIFMVLLPMHEMWNVRPSEKMGASLWISDVIFSLFHAPPVGSLSEMPVATKRPKFCQTKKDCYRREMSTNRPKSQS